MTSPSIDHQALGRSRVVLQYQHSPKFIGYLKALLAAPVELEGVLQKIALQTDIDQAQGVHLDVIGAIVGVGRIAPQSIAVQFFGFQGQAAALPFGQEDYPGNGGRLRDETESGFASSVLADPHYRLLLKAKIVKNHSKGTNEDILKGLSYLFGQGGMAVQVAVNDQGGMAVQVAVGRQLTFLEKALIANLDILPRPAGVRISQRVTYNAENYFGFSDSPQYMSGALTFGEEGRATLGGQFAEEF